jgi:hypothetical protein
VAVQFQINVLLKWKYTNFAELGQRDKCLSAGTNLGWELRRLLLRFEVVFRNFGESLIGSPLGELPH